MNTASMIRALVQLHPALACIPETDEATGTWSAYQRRSRPRFNMNWEPCHMLEDHICRAANRVRG